MDESESNLTPTLNLDLTKLKSFIESSPSSPLKGVPNVKDTSPTLSNTPLAFSKPTTLATRVNFTVAHGFAAQAKADAKLATFNAATRYDDIFNATVTAVVEFLAIEFAEYIVAEVVDKNVTNYRCSPRSKYAQAYAKHVDSAFAALDRATAIAATEAKADVAYEAKVATELSEKIRDLGKFFKDWEKSKNLKR